MRTECFADRLCYVVLMVLLISLTGCAGQRTASKGPYTFWPGSDLPRIQFLTEVNSNFDVIEQQRGFQLISFEAPEKIEFEPIIKPTGVTVHKGKLYVCDAGRTAVFVIDFVNKTFEKFTGAIGRGSFNKPLNLAFSDDDYMYVADVNRQEVLVFDPLGGFVRSFGRDELFKPTDVAVYEDKVYVTDAKDHHVKIYDRLTYKLIDQIGRGSDMSPERLYIPLHMAMDDKGELYVTNTGTGRIIKMDRDGHLLMAFGGMGNVVSLFGRPRGIHVDDQGLIYVVDASHQNIQIFNQEGRLLMFFGGSNEMRLPASVAVSTENLEFFQQYAAPNFELERVVYVSNHFGDKRLAVYGLGQRRGVDYEAEYRLIREEREAEIAREKAEAEQAQEDGAAAGQ
ncbi:MAG: hypothetical protein C0618_11060 [Desulfuromonas sp.]|nr:MAG: hypothetical protein C0618_11060 [Desulfuromonas sp.]